MKKWSLIALAIVVCGVPAAAFADDPQPQVRTWSYQVPPGPRLGVQVTELTEELRTFFAAPKDAGLLVARVQPGTAAAAAGMRVGDVLTNLAGSKIESAGDVRQVLGEKKEGETVPATVIRERKPITLAVKVPKAEPGAPPEAFGGPDFDAPMPRGMRAFTFPNAQQLDDIQRRLDDIEKRLSRLEPH